jgi:hypothetical protein
MPRVSNELHHICVVGIEKNYDGTYSRYLYDNGLNGKRKVLKNFLDIAPYLLTTFSTYVFNVEVA